jgi:hypothetical protein
LLPLRLCVFALQCRRSLHFWQNFFAALAALQSVRITHGREDFFSRRERGARGATTGKEIRQGLFLRALCASARTGPFRQGFGCGVPCQAVEFDLWNKMLGTGENRENRASLDMVHLSVSSVASCSNRVFGCG